jgi:hypothetical protein
MADVRAVKNGNWSDTTVWNTGALPTTADDVYSNTFTVNVNTSFQVLSLRNTSGTGITAGGSFNFNSGSISGSITGATPLFAGAVNLITVTANTGTVTVNAPLSTLTNPGLGTTTQVINHTGNCDFILIGTSFTGQGGSSGDGPCIRKSSVGTIYITANLRGNIASGTGLSGNSGLTSTAGNTVIIGNVFGSTTGTGTAANHGVSQTAGNLTLTGNSTAGNFASMGISFSGNILQITGSINGSNSTSTAFGVSTSATTINISGSITGGAAGNGLVCSSAATINIVGTITPSSTATALSLSGASVLTYSGSLTSANNVPAIISSNASATNIFTGPFINTNDTMAVQCVDMNLTADASTTWNFGDITLFSPERLAFYPSASDIRQGTTYADGTVSGSLAMPPATAVIAGTPTDNTTGSAVLTPTQLQDAVWGRDLSQMTETGSIGNRLARVSTTGTTGAQIASYLL